MLEDSTDNAPGTDEIEGNLAPDHIPPAPERRLLAVFLIFLRLGFTAFGGPAAHISMFRQEFVARRKWLTDEQFLDLLGATNLIPGPNSSEMAIHIGFLHAGWPGLIMGGLAFTLPAVLIVLVLSWAYVQFGTTPQADWLLYGIKPVMIAVIAQALWQLGRKVVNSRVAAVLGICAVSLYFLGINEVMLIFLGGLVLMVIRNWKRLREIKQPHHSLLIPFLPVLGAAVVPFSMTTLFLIFLKIGSILYGGGYVLVAFLRADLVTRLGWITEKQLIDAIAIGQITPGPLFTTATFIGYLLAGVPGALIATLGIILPSFIFVAISNPLIPKLRRSIWAGSFLDGVIIASLGLMGAVGWQIGVVSIVDIPTAAIFAISLVLLLRFRLNSTWLILLGAVVGIILYIFM
jgi:chromate transporter